MHVTYPNNSVELVLREDNATNMLEWRIKCSDCPGKVKLYSPLGYFGRNWFTTPRSPSFIPQVQEKPYRILAYIWKIISTVSVWTAASPLLALLVQVLPVSPITLLAPFFCFPFSMTRPLNTMIFSKQTTRRVIYLYYHERKSACSEECPNFEDFHQNWCNREQDVRRSFVLHFIHLELLTSG